MLNAPGRTFHSGWLELEYFPTLYVLCNYFTAPGHFLPSLIKFTTCTYIVVFGEDSRAPLAGFLQLFFSIDLPFQKSALQLLDAFPSPSSHLLSLVDKTSSDLFLLLPTLWTLPPHRKLGQLWTHLMGPLLLGAMVLQYLFSSVMEQLFHVFCAIF